MPNTTTNVVNILRSLVSLTVLGLLSVAGWFGYRAYDEWHNLDAKLQATTAELAEQKAEVGRLTIANEKLDLALRLLKIDHRVAEITVLEKRETPAEASTDEKAGADDAAGKAPRLATKFQFAELTTDGAPIGEPKVFTVVGDVIYVDAWVIKYADDLIETADPLRKTSVCLFRRVFGEFQEPSAGFSLDANGSRPAVYSQGNEMPPIERDIWKNFWEYANNPAKAQLAGVRAVHGEAPSIQLEEGQRYRVELRASGGLSIVPDKTAKPSS